LTEVLGFPVSDQLRIDLAALHMRFEKTPALALLLESELEPSAFTTAEHVERRYVADSRVWLKTELKLPRACFDHIVTWLMERGR
jgi:hypothetical protein